MKRVGKWLAYTILAIFLLVILLVLFLFVFDWNLAKGYIESKASTATGREIKIGGIGLHFNHDFAPTFDIENVSISNMPNGSAPQMLNAGRINFRFNVLSAFSKQLDFPFIGLDNANVILEKNKDGTANWVIAGSNKKSDAAAPKIGQLWVRNSKVSYKDATQGTDLTVVADSSRDADGKMNGVNTQDVITVKGDGAYKNAPFKLDYTGGSLLQLENNAKPYPINTTVTIAKTTINVQGTVVDPTKLQGLDITLNVKGANAADLFPITGIALPPTPPFSVTGKLDYQDKVWKFNGFKGKMGDSDLSGGLSFDKSKARPLFTAKFVSQSLNFKDLGGLVGGPPPKDQPSSKLTAEQKEKIVHREESPYVIPDAPLDISRLAAMDANVEFTGEKVISPNLPLDNFYMHVTLDNLLLKVDPVKFGTANGDIQAELTVNARETPVQITSDFQFKRLQLSRLFEKMPIGDKNNFKGYIGGVAKLKGTGKSLREMLSHANGDIGIGMEGGQLSNLVVKLIGLDVAKALGLIVTGDEPVAVRCIIGDFAVDNGVMHSRNITIDTANSNIQGKGTINLGTEKMDIELQAHQKDKTVLSLRSPINITGTLKNPSVGISPENLIVRSGVAAAASVALTPFVAALAFIEPGLGKDSDCAKMLNDMNQHTDSSKTSNLVPKNANAPVAQAKPNSSKQKAQAATIKPQNATVSTPALPGEYQPAH